MAVVLELRPKHAAALGGCGTTKSSSLRKAGTWKPLLADNNELGRRRSDANKVGGWPAHAVNKARILGILKPRKQRAQHHLCFGT